MKAKITASIIFSLIVNVCVYVAIGSIISLVTWDNGFNFIFWSDWAAAAFFVVACYITLIVSMTIME